MPKKRNDPSDLIAASISDLSCCLPGTLIRMDVLAKRSFCVGLILVCMALTGTVTDAQNYRGEAVPVLLVTNLEHQEAPHIDSSDDA